MEANAITYEVSELKTSYLLIPKLARKWFEIERLVRVGPDDLVGADWSVGGRAHRVSPGHRRFAPRTKRPGGNLGEIIAGTPPFMSSICMVGGPPTRQGNRT